jgi:ribosome-binding factor A
MCIVKEVNMNKQRIAGIEKEIGRVISKTLMLDVKNVKLKEAIVSVNHVRVTEDLKFADVYFTVMPLNGKNIENTEIFATLENIKGLLRKKISEELGLRFTPEVRIKTDDSVDHAMKITKLLNEIKGQ